MLRRLLSVFGIYSIYRRWLRSQINPKNNPKHIGIILDGNRRWAANKQLNPWEGHKEGATKVKSFLKWCIDLGIKTVTLYVFSTENFQRPKKEVDELMKIAEENLKEILNSSVIHQNKVRIKAIGRLNLLPETLRELIYKVEEATKNYDSFYLNLALAYGGRAEIIDAVKKIAYNIAEKKLDSSKIDEALFEKYLYTSYLPQPDPDLIIRTSGESRLSGFLLWQSAYSELFFVDVYWPDFREIDLERVLRAYQFRHRRFGK